jgi:hypothetical protein
MNTCPRCQRANPADAVYCHHDGMALRVPGGGKGVGTLPHEFVFTSGRRCRTYDDLVQGCHYEWEDARVLLRKGVFAQYMAGIGRMDLVRAAKEAQGNSDPDIALHAFVSALPVAQVQGPRLELSPRRLVLNNLLAGESRSVALTVSNGGKGLLQGKLTVINGGDWLKLADGDDSEYALKTAREQQVKLRVSTRGLVPKTYGAKLTVITNGGIAEVPVRLDVTALPFPRAPFQSAGSPRQLAERMREHPKQAVPLLENGEIVRWFAANGWTYPVQGPPARGVAAVQQFFEGMGLSKPPVVVPVETELHFACVPPEVAPGRVLLRTTAKKWVYAAAESNRHWLRVPEPSASGPQQAAIEFEIDSSIMDEGMHEGTIEVTANAGQHFTIHVFVDVRPLKEPFTRRLLRPFLTGLLLGLLYRLCLALPADVLARVLWPPAGAEGTPGSFATWLRAPVPESGFAYKFVLATWWVGALLGAVWLGRRGGRPADLLCGGVAGAVAGLIGAATLACLWPALDLPPRLAWAALHRAAPDGTGSAWLWTTLWIMTAAACWAVLGGVVGLGLGLAGGKKGARLLAGTASPWAWLFGACGLRPAADVAPAAPRNLSVPAGSKSA